MQKVHQEVYALTQTMYKEIPIYSKAKEEMIIFLYDRAIKVC